jgi:predicted nucleotidyltransferase
MNEGFEHRVQAKIQKVSNFSELIDQLKTKRYTQNRIQRLLAYLLIGLKNELLIKNDREIPIRILGFTGKGRQFLNKKKQEKTLPFISKIGSKVGGMELTLRADKIYQLGSKEILEQNYGRVPILC